MNYKFKWPVRFFCCCFVLFFFNWSVVDLQCCANFCCIAKRLSYTHSLFNILSYYGVSQEIGYISLCCISRTLLFICSKCNSLHQLTPGSQFIPLPSHLPFGNHSLFSMSVSLFLICRSVHVCSILDSIYKWYHMVFVFLFLTYLVW